MIIFSFSHGYYYANDFEWEERKAGEIRYIKSERVMQQTSHSN